MIRRRLRPLHASVLATALLGLCSALVLATEIDPGASRIGFTLKTRWGQLLVGRFPDPRGEVVELPDGRHRVDLQLSTASVEIVGHPSYTRFTRGKDFFDAADFPRVEFHSDAYSPALLREGGALTGELTIRDHRHREVFTIVPATCASPAKECDVVASGTIHRSNYDMGRWNFALSDQVRFALRVRIRRPDA